VLELPAGEARHMALQPGERLVLQPEVKKDEPPADSDRR
jgi:hypothetical protein